MRRLALPARLPRQISRRISRQRAGVALAVTALVLGSLAAAVAVLAVRVDGASMAPTLRDGERVLLRPFSGGDSPARFAVVVGRFRTGGPLVVKRVIGLPGDRIEVSAGRVSVQPGGTGAWVVVDNPAWPAGSLGSTPCCGPDGRASTRAQAQPVPDGMLFLMGDNPAASEDSRTFGWAPVALLDGVVGWRVHPPGRLGGVGVEVGLRPTVDKSLPPDPR